MKIQSSRIQRMAEYKTRSSVLLIYSFRSVSCLQSEFILHWERRMWRPCHRHLVWKNDKMNVRQKRRQKISGWVKSWRVGWPKRRVKECIFGSEKEWAEGIMKAWWVRWSWNQVNWRWWCSNQNQWTTLLDWLGLFSIILLDSSPNVLLSQHHGSSNKRFVWQEISREVAKNLHTEGQHKKLEDKRDKQNK